jgi:hypothetical protein
MPKSKEDEGRKELISVRMSLYAHTHTHTHTHTPRSLPNSWRIDYIRLFSIHCSPGVAYRPSSPPLGHVYRGGFTPNRALIIEKVVVSRPGAGMPK